MARKTRRRGKGGKGGKRVRGTRRVIRVRRSRGGKRRYNSEGGNPFPTLGELGSQVRNIGSEIDELGKNAYVKARELSSQKLAEITNA